MGNSDTIFLTAPTEAGTAIPVRPSLLRGCAVSRSPRRAMAPTRRWHGLRTLYDLSGSLYCPGSQIGYYWARCDDYCMADSLININAT
ncbi:hypothetical protein Cob_v004505 [Colletotrichum orbiculare MAFF 240422]|uniref:Uncharacterized protein n=1 Tax=Colletotrichum orbiculare (strain 104-T / ATCC 96160 / CBS 514.97 / LARS 414 / MAFF 240422) TaxID=1213857 RepID=A0A484FV94_COLOR|nr:hypothetical protein Cob_v004505 [Colletotrichum orbiculare MAFF 240422]